MLEKIKEARKRSRPIFDRWSDPYYVVGCSFKDRELKDMPEKEVRDLVRLAKDMIDMLIL